MKRFNELVAEAIGKDRTQKQFAADAGISKNHITNMLKDDFSSKPTDETLEKIADHSAGRVTVLMLKEALNMNITDKDKEKDIWKMPYKRRNAIIAEELKDGFKQMANSSQRFENLHEVMKTVDMISARCDTTFYVTAGKDIPGNDAENHKGAEKYANGYFFWEDDECEVQLGLTFFYCETTGGGVMVTGIAFDVKTLYKYQNTVALEIKDGLTVGDEEADPDDYSIAYLTTIKQKTPTLTYLTKDGYKPLNETKEMTEQRVYDRLLDEATPEEMVALEAVIKRLKGE